LITTILFNGYQGSLPALKQLGHEINHSPPSSAQVKNDWSYTSTPPVCLCGMDRENCTCLTTVLGVDLSYTLSNGDKDEYISYRKY